MSPHEPIEPSSENGGASWFCPDCDTPCSSDNPCDCCETDGWWET